MVYLFIFWWCYGLNSGPCTPVFKQVIIKAIQVDMKWYSIVSVSLVTREASYWPFNIFFGEMPLNPFPIFKLIILLSCKNYLCFGH
jgi:hypothetical protein